MAGVIQPLVRHVQTHLVLQGPLKYPAYQDGDTLRALDDGRKLAERRRDGTWSRPVKATPAKRPGKYDSIKPLGPAVVVQLTKGRHY